MPETASEPGGWWPTPQMHTLRAFVTRLSEYVYRSDYTPVRERVTWRLAVGVLEQPQCLDHLPLEQWQSVVLMLSTRFGREPEDSDEDWVGRLLAAMRALPEHVELFAEPDQSFMCFDLLWDGLVFSLDEVLAERGPEFAEVMIEWAETGIEPLRASAWNGLDVLVREVRLTPSPVALYDRALLERAFAMLPGFEEWVMRGYYPKPLPASGESTM